MTDDIQSVSDLKRALEDGRCFVAELPRVKVWYQFFEEYGPACTETDLDNSDPCTGPAGQGDMRAALRYGVEEVESSEIPYTEDE